MINLWIPYPGQQMLGTLRTRNQAQNLEAAGRAYLKSFLVLNRMSVRPVFFCWLSIRPFKRAWSKKHFPGQARGTGMVDGAKVARTLVDIENPMQPFISQIWNSTHCCYCSYKLTGNEIRVTGFPFSKKSRDTILHPGKLHPLKKLI